MSEDIIKRLTEERQKEYEEGINAAKKILETMEWADLERCIFFDAEDECLKVTWELIPSELRPKSTSRTFRKGFDETLISAYQNVLDEGL